MDVTVLWLKWKIEMHFAKNISLIAILISLRRRQSKPPDYIGDFMTRPDATQAKY